MTLHKKITGCGTALVTPFTRDGAIDVVALKRLIDFQLNEGIDFLVPCGSTGESATLALEEELLIVETVLEKTGKRIPVMAGAGSNCTNTAIETAKAMERLGVDALLSVVPYYVKPTQEGLYQHFKAVAESVNVPIYLYNIPGRSVVNMQVDTIARLAEIENIVGLKEATGNIGQMSEQAMRLPEDFIVLSGDDPNTLPLIALGGHGLISVAANVIPATIIKIVHFCLENRFEKAREIQKGIYPLQAGIFMETNPIPIKYALSKMGLIEEAYRLPLTPMHASNKATMDQILIDLNLIETCESPDGASPCSTN